MDNFDYSGIDDNSELILPDNEIVTGMGGSDGVNYLREVDWSNFGVPFPVKMHEDAQRLAKKWKSGEELTEEEIVGLQYWGKKKIEQKVKAERDPIAWGWTFLGWQKAMEYLPKARCLLIGGGQRSSKSSFAAKAVVNAALQLKEAKIRCFHETEARSIEDQQTFVYDALPMHYRGVPIKDVLRPKGKNYSIDYKQKSGFSGSKNGNPSCVLPPIWPYQARGSSIIFNNYQQWVNKNNVFEGMKAHMVWGDEQMPFKLFETLLSRNDATVDMRMLLTFTMIDGYTELVQSIMGDAETLEWRHSDVMGEKIPIVMKSRKYPDTYVIFFWTQDNPYAGFERLKEMIEPQGKAAMMTKLFGIPQKMSNTKFPKFHTDVHVVSPVDVPPASCTNYLSVDPGEVKNWAMGWYKVDKYGRMWVYREWPDFNNYGMWAEPTSSGQSSRGTPGPAQKVLGLGFSGYHDLIEKKENAHDEDKNKRERIFERIMDPRGNKERTTDDGSTTVIDEMRKLGMYFAKAKVGKDNNYGMNMLNEWIDYKPEWLEKVIEAKKNNQPWFDIPGGPKLFISSDCKNIISCLQNFTGGGGNDEATKDFVDVLKYAVCSQPIHIPKNFVRKTGGCAY